MTRLDVSLRGIGPDRRPGYYCDHCAATVESGWQYCGQCGGRLGWRFSGVVPAPTDAVEWVPCRPVRCVGLQGVSCGHRTA